MEDQDIDRIADKVQIKIMQAFEDHRVKDHEPLKVSIAVIRGKLSTHKSISAISGALGGVLGFLGAWLSGTGGHK